MDDKNKMLNKFFVLLIIDITVCFLIFSSVLILKYFFKGDYENFKNWYKSNVLSDTDIEEVLGENYEN